MPYAFFCFTAWRPGGWCRRSGTVPAAPEPQTMVSVARVSSTMVRRPMPAALHTGLPGFFSGERCKKHATVLALSADKSSSLSHQETGGRNPHEALEYNSPRPRLCQWHLHATWSILELERGSCRLYYAPNVSTSKPRLSVHVNNCPWVGAAARPFSK